MGNFMWLHQPESNNKTMFLNNLQKLEPGGITLLEPTSNVSQMYPTRIHPGYSLVLLPSCILGVLTVHLTPMTANNRLCQQSCKKLIRIAQMNFESEKVAHKRSTKTLQKCAKTATKVPGIPANSQSDHFPTSWKLVKLLFGQ